MNEHLKPVFSVILPELEKAGIHYWVYGGVSIAAFAKKFIRENGDVDTFVVDTDFEKANKILNDLSERNNFTIERSENPDGRPKVTITVSGKRIFELIPVYIEKKSVVFKYPAPDENQIYSEEILKRIKRNISDMHFVTSQDEYIKKLFIEHMKVRPDKKERLAYKIDAKAILNLKELHDFGWNL